VGDSNFLVDYTPHPPNILTYNFAITGASLTQALWPPYMLSPKSLNQPVEEQVSETFMGLCGPEADAQKCGWKPETALFMFFGGVNDILSTFMLNTERAPDRVIRRYRGSIARLYDDGARNFLLLNVPPIERIGVAGEDTAQKRADVEDFNRLLRVMRNSLMREFTDMSVRLFDTNKLWGTCSMIRTRLSRPRASQGWSIRAWRMLGRTLYLK